jgi:WD40 repeat protein
MRRLFVVLTVAFFVAVLLPGSSSLVSAQSNDCQMLGWTGLAILPETQLGWQGDIENVAGTAARDLVDVETFGWSPDGRRLAYMDASGPADPVLRIATDPLGTDPSTIAGVSGTSIVWSPTGDRVLLSSRADDAISVVDRNGVVTTLDPQGRDAAWSFDGIWVAWTSADGIHIAHPDGTGPALLAPAPANGVLWRPNTHQLLVLAPSFLIADADTLALTPFTVDPANFAGGFAWSPSGDRLAWSASSDGTASPRIWVDSFDGAGAQPVSPLLALPADSSTFAPFSAPFWSPDGRQIAAGESNGGWGSGFMLGHVRVRLLSADGSSDGVPLTDFVGVDTPINFAALLLVTWSPDQRWVAVEIRSAGLIGGSSETFVGYSIAAIDGSVARDLGSSFRERGHVEWWPVVGVIGAGGACVLATDEDAPAPGEAGVPPAATHPQFTG